MQTKLIFIGPINDNGGSGIKNGLFLERFNEFFDRVITIDTAMWRKRPWLFLVILWRLLSNREAKVVISASENSRYLINFLYYFPINKNVYYWVVGFMAKTNIIRNLSALKKLKKIIVQGKSMVHQLNKLGLDNAVYVPNSKPIFTIQRKEKFKNDFIKFVFLSRVHPEKGIKEITEACSILNNNGFSSRYVIDFYGPIYDGYYDIFYQSISGLKNIKYRGILNLKEKAGYEQLSAYDIMLFPTYWKGEGFPGVVLDAYMAGLPIIATHWNLNDEVIIEGKTGTLIPAYDSNALAIEMMKFINAEYNLEQMQMSCLEYVKQFDYKNVINKGLLQELGLL